MDCRVKTRGAVSEPEAEHYVSILDLMDCRVKTEGNSSWKIEGEGFQSLI